ERARVRHERLGARVGRVDGDVDDLRDRERPVADRLEALLVPVAVRDDVDRDADPERARELQRLEVARERDALPEGLEALLVDRLEAEEHVLEAERLPVFEDFLVLQEHVAARLEVVGLLDLPLLDLLADRVAVVLLDEGHVVDDEDARLLDRSELVADALDGALAVAAAVERPRRAEGAVPRAAARELDRSARVEDADEVLLPVAEQVARG